MRARVSSDIPSILRRTRETGRNSPQMRPFFLPPRISPSFTIRVVSRSFLIEFRFRRRVRRRQIRVKYRIHVRVQEYRVAERYIVR